MLRSLVGALGLGADIVVLMQPTTSPRLRRPDSSSEQAAGLRFVAPRPGGAASVPGWRIEAPAASGAALPIATTRWPFAFSTVGSMAGTMLRAGFIRSLST
jgi:hypothetical protein